MGKLTTGKNKNMIKGLPDLLYNIFHTNSSHKTMLNSEKDMYVCLGFICIGNGPITDKRDCERKIIYV